MKTMHSRMAIFIISLALLCTSMPAYALDIPGPSARYYVSDFAGALNDETCEYIMDNAPKLYEACGAQIVIATVSTILDAPIDEYAQDMFNYWGIGSAEENNGVLLVMDISGGNYYCTVGSGLGEDFDNAIIKQMLDEYLEPYFAEGDYSAGARAVFSCWFKALNEYYSAGLSIDLAPALSKAQVEAVVAPLSESFVGIDELLAELDAQVSSRYRMGHVMRAVSQPGSTRVIAYEGMALAVPASGRRVTMHGREYICMSSGGYMWLDSVNGVSDADLDNLSNSVIAGISESGATIKRRGPLVVNRTVLREVGYTSDNLAGETYMLVRGSRFIIINFAQSGAISDKFETEIIDCIYSIADVSGM